MSGRGLSDLCFGSSNVMGCRMNSLSLDETQILIVIHKSVFVFPESQTPILTGEEIRDRETH